MDRHNVGPVSWIGRWQEGCNLVRDEAGLGTASEVVRGVFGVIVLFHNCGGVLQAFLRVLTGCDVTASSEAF